VTDDPRILLVTKGLDLGGIERIVVDLASGLAARGVDVEVAVVNSERDRLIPPLVDAGVTVHRLGGSDLVGVGASRRLVALIRSGGFDVIHVHGPLPAVVARLGALRSAATVMTTSHTPWTSLRPTTRTLWRATSGLDVAAVAVSSAVAGSLPRRSRSRITVIPHGIDPARIAAARAAANRSPASSSGGAITVVAVASHRDAKNYPNLLRAIRLAIDAGAKLRLVTVGDGPALDTHVALARTLGIGDDVDFTPATADVLHRIAGADVLAVASDYEGQPIVVAEALALGVPVVATAVGRIPEMVDATVGRVVPPRDPTALGGALRELADDPDLRTRLGVNARQLPVRTLDDVLDAHVALYGQHLASTHPRIR
jgi:glycosyltransferase involved in cell wall biosynthesis